MIYSDIPTIINNYNRLTTTKKLVEDLLRLGCTNIIILDNNSDYPPLLEWYDQTEKNNNKVRLHILDNNLGHKALWKSGLINHLKSYPYIIYTDSDIELNKRMPKNFIDILIKLSKEYKFDKIGLAIKIDNLPNNFVGEIIKQTEAIYWVNKLFNKRYELYQGMIDTTFALFNPNIPFQYSALRIAGDFTCSHTPWYTDFDNISEEELYFINSCNPEISTYAGHYFKHKNKTNG